MSIPLRAAPTSLRRPAQPSVARREALRAYTALALMSDCRARIEEWLDLADQCNVAEALAIMGKVDSSTVQPKVDAAVAGLVIARRCPDGMMQMGPAIVAMREVVSVVDDALQRFSVQTITEATNLVRSRIYAAKADPGVTVVGGRQR